MITRGYRANKREKNLEILRFSVKISEKEVFVHNLTDEIANIESEMDVSELNGEETTRNYEQKCRNKKLIGKHRQQK